MTDKNLQRAIRTILSMYDVNEITKVRINDTNARDVEIKSGTIWNITFDTDRITPSGKRISVSMPVVINYVDVE